MTLILTLCLWLFSVSAFAAQSGSQDFPVGTYASPAVAYNGKQYFLSVSGADYTQIAVFDLGLEQSTDKGATWFPLCSTQGAISDPVKKEPTVILCQTVPGANMVQGTLTVRQGTVRTTLSYGQK